MNEVKYNCLPENKMSAIENYQKNNEIIAMVGDGVNDAPSLKKSDVGIAMGGIGSDIAIDASDITLISDDIKNLPHLLAISQKTMKTINISISFALILNFLAMVLAMAGLIGPIVGALIHNIGSVLVIFYSSLLLNYN